MSKIITLRKGLDINLRGKAQESLADAPQASEYALSPLDFEGVTPKLLVKVGDEVKAGTPLFFNKYSERVLFTSPVSGTVAAVNRGEKRKVLSVTVTPDATQSYEEFAKPDLQKASREEIVELLLRSGLWPAAIFPLLACVMVGHSRPRIIRSPLLLAAPEVVARLHCALLGHSGLDGGLYHLGPGVLDPANVAEAAALAAVLGKIII